MELCSFSDPPIPCKKIGHVMHPMEDGGKDISISCNGETVYRAPLAGVRDVWESTSFELEALQCRSASVEARGISDAICPGNRSKVSIYFVPSFTPMKILSMSGHEKHKVAIVRQEGSNGDREMQAAFYLAGFGRGYKYE